MVGECGRRDACLWHIPDTPPAACDGGLPAGAGQVGRRRSRAGLDPWRTLAGAGFGPKRPDWQAEQDCTSLSFKVASGGDMERHLAAMLAVNAVGYNELPARQVARDERRSGNGLHL